MKISAHHISKAFGTFPALNDITLDIPSNSLVALLGPSGSGKTTLLRVIAGLEMPEKGSIYFGQTDVTELAIQKRNIGFVFQNYALFAHMTVAANIGFGLKVSKEKRNVIEQRTNELLMRMQLAGLGDRMPSELSGGQQQRVALARALAKHPKLLLLDEPFGALDAKVRKDLRKWLRALHKEIHVTTIFVTHDQQEAFEVADSVVILNEGQIEQQGTVGEIFESPASPFVQDFVDSGRTNAHTHQNLQTIGQ